MIPKNQNNNNDPASAEGSRPTQPQRLLIVHPIKAKQEEKKNYYAKAKQSKQILYGQQCTGASVASFLLEI